MDPLSIALASARAEVDADRPALIAEGEILHYAELAARVERLAGVLAREGVALGSRVALSAQSRVETVIAIHALLSLGATLVPVHPRLTEAEVAVLLADAAPDHVLREADLSARIAAGIEGSPSPPGAFEPETPLAMVYTSGTSGRPKGAVLSRRAFVASADASAASLGWEPSDRWLLCMPLCHVGGLSILTRCLLARRPVILVPRFEPRAVLAAIVRDRASILSVVPTMLAALLDEDRDGILPRLRAVLLGGAAAPPLLLEECGRRGVPALTTYGLTEACSQVTVQRPRSPYRPEPGSGTPLAGVALQITGDDGAALEPGSVGRIRIGGPTLMSGYFRGADRLLDPAVDAEGLFDTGDLGALDEAGRLHVHARRTDLIVTGGENVYPVEVEQCLEALPGVRRALVFGVPDARWGQVVACALELDGAGSSGEALFALLLSRLAAHKRPRLFCAVDALPLTGSGKLDRARAVERYRERLTLLGPLRPRETEG
jgi:o-succinylbenzoate---CoA ligase